jgi:predicted O-linked N-acetylglucosamine transferase (SPINDLY family)
MNELEVFEQAKVYLEQGNYEQSVELLEQCIEANEENVNYYWYLGLAYLLQGQEENAQTTWLLVMSQGDEEEVVQWTQELLTILETEAQRQEQIENLKLSWLIRGHIREIEPGLINNLLHLIDLEIKLQYYEPEHLEDWQIVDYLKNNLIESADSQLLFKIIPDVLNFPFVVNIDFIEACLKYIPDLDSLISTLKTKAIEIAYDQHKPNYSINLIKICTQLKPNDLELINYLYQFSCIAKDYGQVLQSAKDFLSNAGTPDLKALGYYKVVQALITCGEWLKAQEIVPNYIVSLRQVIELSPKMIDPMVQGCVHILVGSLMYLQDNPSEYRQLQNHLSRLFQDYLSDLLLFSGFRINFHYPRALKIGYIAHTLRRHSVGWLSRWLMHYHNREQFQVYLYLINQQEDDITQTWFREKADFVYNFPFNLKQIVDQIQQDEIDILIDLDSFSHGITCQVLALKPAPIQITWLGFDASGIPAIDYFIADPYVLPDNAQEYYQETLWRLPQTYLAVDGFEVAVPTLKRENLDISNDAIIYLTIQTGEKRHPDTIRLQMQILQAVPNSYLLIKGEGDQQSIQKLFKTIAEENQISLDRLRFLERTPSEEIHRANLSIADVVLDTYPYNGATTTLETLWMGIPLVTKVGQQFAARNSYTFMINAGLTEGIAWTDEEYIDWGIKLGQDENLRQQIIWKLEQSKKTAPLWNAKQFTQEMEKAYQQMWVKYIEDLTLA